MAKNSPVATPRRRPQTPVSPDTARNWYRETRSELRKVTWPTFDQTRNLTLVVLAVCIIMAIFLGVVDSLLRVVIQFVTGAPI